MFLLWVKWLMHTAEYCDIKSSITTQRKAHYGIVDFHERSRSNKIPQDAEFWCKCYLELKSGSVSLTSVRGQEEVPIRLLETEKESQASGSSSRFVTLFVQHASPV